MRCTSLRIIPPSWENRPPRWLSGKEPTCQCLATWVQSLGWEEPLEKEMATQVFLPGESHEQRRLVGCSPWSHRESDTTEQLTLSLLLFWGNMALITVKCYYKSRHYYILVFSSFASFKVKSQ